MTNNPFTTKNRFAFLDDDEIPNKFNKKKNNNTKDNSTNENTTKENNISSDKTTNVFLNPKQNNNNYRDRERSNQYFKENKKQIKHEPELPKFDLVQESFPEIIQIINKIDTTESIDTNIKQEISFKNILATIIPEEPKIINHVKPGWVEVSKVNGKIVLKYGPKTLYQNRHQYLENLKEQPKYIMNNAIKHMKYNWKRYAESYDELHGEGAYEEAHSLPPVYDSDYEDSDNSENQESEVDEY